MSGSVDQVVVIRHRAGYGFNAVETEHHQDIQYHHAGTHLADRLDGGLTLVAYPDNLQIRR